jgi:2-haloacid dehalogenase
MDSPQAADPLQCLEVTANGHFGAVEFRRKCADLDFIALLQRLHYELMSNMHIHDDCSTIYLVSSHIPPDRRIDAVVFDLGGVLLDWNPRHLYRKLFTDADQMECFLREICTTRWHDAHDRGVPTANSCADLATRYPEWSDLIWAWSTRSEEMVAGPIAASVDVLHDLKISGTPCYALTNMEAETYPLRRQRFRFLRWFDGTIVSGNVGIAKPDMEIFVLLLDRFALKASTTLMIDDSLENLAVAERVGLQTLHFHSPEQLKNGLESLSLLPWPS